ncbi:MAG: hypothetical protein NW208_10190 [Bryobacter sp.]|nr:hypothetical protein [Bryobacter sp.]
MEVPLSSKRRAFLEERVRAGRFASVAEALDEALQQWEEKERLRIEILAGLDLAQRSLEVGGGRRIEGQGLIQLGEEIKRRGRLVSQ